MGERNTILSAYVSLWGFLNKTILENGYDRVTLFGFTDIQF